MDPEQLLLRHLGLVDRIVAFVARRNGLRGGDADEFRSIVRLKLIANDYRIFRQFQQRSSLSTYLTTVIHRLFLDYRISLWGKWRASAEARRLGPLAVRLETLMMRDGLSFEEASQVMRTSEHVEATEAELRELSARLPARGARVLVGDEALEDRADPAADAEHAVQEAEAAASGRQLQGRLAHALDALEGQDRLILRLRFEQGLSVAEIGAALGLPAKPLYRRIERLLAALRRDLEARGVRPEDVAELIGRMDLAEPAGGPEIRRPDPSLLTGSGA